LVRWSGWQRYARRWPEPRRNSPEKASWLDTGGDHRRSLGSRTGLATKSRPAIGDYRLPISFDWSNINKYIYYLGRSSRATIPFNWEIAAE
jgi:hypothetical protein